jgi:hypothetical protein
LVANKTFTAGPPDLCLKRKPGKAAAALGFQVYRANRDKASVRD